MKIAIDKKKHRHTLNCDEKMFYKNRKRSQLAATFLRLFALFISEDKEKKSHRETEFLCHNTNTHMTL
jgi:hypothetical protein